MCAGAPSAWPRTCLRRRSPSGERRPPWRRAFDLQGHRGARGLAPENTLAGFRKALEIGVSTLELDLAPDPGRRAGGVPRSGAQPGRGARPRRPVARPPRGRRSARSRSPSSGATTWAASIRGAAYAQQWPQQAPADGERRPDARGGRGARAGLRPERAAERRDEGPARSAGGRAAARGVREGGRRLLAGGAARADRHRAVVRLAHARRDPAARPRDPDRLPDDPAGELRQRAAGPTRPLAVDGRPRRRRRSAARCRAWWSAPAARSGRPSSGS